MANMILCAHQITVDYNYQVRDVTGLLGTMCGKLKDELGKIDMQPVGGGPATLYEVLEDISKHGLAGDKNVALDSNNEAVAPVLQSIRSFLEQPEVKTKVHIGGNPAIMAYRGHCLRKGVVETDLPLIFYAGLYPRSVQQAIEKDGAPGAADWQRLIRIRKPIEKQPQTIGIQDGKFKVMLVFPPGRSILELASGEEELNEFLSKVDDLRAGNPTGVAVLAMNIGKEAQDGEHDRINSLLKKAKNQAHPVEGGRAMKTFVSTSGFDGNVDAAKAVLKVLMDSKPSIISMSESEVVDLHTAYVGHHRDEPIAYKLRDLPLEAIKVCHSADGVIMDICCNPDDIVTSRKFATDPTQFLDEVLTLSADGASFAMEANPLIGRTANETTLRVHSRHISDAGRKQQLFKTTFLKTVNEFPGGMLGVASATVPTPRGAIVGLGAIFDGLLLSFLLRD